MRAAPYLIIFLLIFSCKKESEIRSVSYVVNCENCKVHYNNGDGSAVILDSLNADSVQWRKDLKVVKGQYLLLEVNNNMDSNSIGAQIYVDDQLFLADIKPDHIQLSGVCK